MRFSVVASRDSPAESPREAANLIREELPSSSLRSDFGPPTPEMLLAIGDDHFMLETLSKVAHDTAILTIGKGFLSEISPERLKEAIQAVKKGDFWVEKRLRLEVKVDEKASHHALNEAALSSSKGAGFLRYTLEIDGERVWRDSGDGVVVSTPTGSTGYCLSAGGPVVMENAEAMVVVPICSASGRKPLVIAAGSLVTISEIESRMGRDLVIDGIRRVKMKGGGFSVQASKFPAQFVRFGKARYLRVFGKLESRAGGAEVPTEAAPSAKFVFWLLRIHGPLSERQLMSETGLPERTVRSALGYLVDQDLVKRLPSLRDTRKAVFAASP